MFDSVSIASRGNAEVLIIGQFKGQSLDADTKKLDPEGVALAATKRAEASGEVGSVLTAFPSSPKKNEPSRILIVGLGDKADFSAGALRNVGAAIGRALAGAKATSASIALDSALSKLAKSKQPSAHDTGAMLGEGLGLISWTYDDLKGTANPAPKRDKLKIISDDAKLRAGLERGLALAEGSNEARRLSQTPPNIATTSWIASEAKKMARKVGLKCTVIQGKALEDEQLVGLINVGKASENKPCLIRLEYTPARGASKRPIVLVGKTMTYDSGGLSIKVGGGMRGMKRDKDGGCAVFGAMHAIATTIKPNRPVVALLSCAENSISDEAYRPDDVITFRNGVTVEVTNTDAEGRLVMADALCWACDKENPEYVVDTATLTGGVVVALGSVYAGLWSNDDALAGKVECAAAGSDERVWRLPLHPDYKAMMKSPVADIVNSAPVREAHPIQGAAFLEHFVADGVKWAHLDIAGTHATDKDSGCFIPGPTGFGARLLANLVEQG